MHDGRASYAFSGDASSKLGSPTLEEVQNPQKAFSARPEGELESETQLVLGFSFFGFLLKRTILLLIAHCFVVIGSVLNFGPLAY